MNCHSQIKDEDVLLNKTSALASFKKMCDITSKGIKTAFFCLLFNLFFTYQIQFTFNIM